MEKRLSLFKPYLVGRGFADYPENVEYGNIVTGLPLAQGSASAIYSSHVLEHLSLLECRSALRNVFSYLRPGGTFRLVVPDLEVMISTYRENPRADAALQFIDATDMGEKGANGGIRALPRRLLGRSRHKWLWDYKSLRLELETIGFSEIRRARFGDSSVPACADIETADRWGDNLGMECRRPAE